MFSWAILGLASAGLVWGRPTTDAAAATPTLYLCGDSTMARLGNNDGATDGWGDQVTKYLSLPVSNMAIAGRSARSYTREGRFTTVINSVKAGDYIVIEFGHNDGGSLTPTDNGRTDCPGSGDETCQTVFDGVAETVLTYYAYLRNAANSLKAKGANVIISSPTPDNPWETGTFTYTANRFTTMSQSVAKDTAETFIDHGQYVADRFDTLGDAVVTGYYPEDHTHTSPTGADVVAQTFIRGLICQKTSTLNSFLTTAGKGVPSRTSSLHP